MTTAAVVAGPAACWHCGDAMPAAGGMEAPIGGTLRPMCCPGCVAAASWIEQLGLGDYYRLREHAAPWPGTGRGPGPPAVLDPERPASGLVDGSTGISGADDPGHGRGRVRGEPDRGWLDSLERHVLRPAGDGRTEIMLLVDGMRCAACVWFIERALRALAGVHRVQVNAAARRARIVFDPAAVSVSTLIATLTRAGYRPLPLDRSALDDSRRRESRDAIKRLMVAGFGMMQAMMFAGVLYVGAGDLDDATLGLFRWLGFLVATPVVFYAARPFFAGARRALAAGRMSMDVPVALAVALIYLASLLSAMGDRAEVYFDSVSMFVFFLLCGRQVEMRARHRAGDLTDAIARLAPAFADRRRPDGSLERVAAAGLAVGDRVRVAVGDAVPADGTLASAACLVDESLLTGETEPVDRRHGDRLIAGSLVIDGPAEVFIDRVGADTTLAAILGLVTRAQVEKPRLAMAGERAAGLFVARILVLTLATAALWAAVDPTRAFDAALAVLVVSCPCAFALAVPAAVARALAVLARRGVLVVRPDAIEALAGVTRVVFDKTGTLTDRRLTLTRTLVFASTLTEDGALRQAAILACESRHPASRAIVAAAEAGAQPAGSEACDARAVDVVCRAGFGVEATVGGRRLRLGRAEFALAGAPAPAGLEGAVVLADETGLLAAFRLAERLRPDAREAVARLEAAGLGVEILSGDAASRVAAVAEALGIVDWQAGQRPEDKLARLAHLRAGGAVVLVIGDGVNDAPILAGADVAVALASGVDLAKASSDIMLAGERLSSVAAAHATCRRTLAILRQNQRWAIAYNLLAVPLAAFGWVTPWLAAIGMSASSLFVVLNALRIDFAEQRLPPCADRAWGGAGREGLVRDDAVPSAVGEGAPLAGPAA